MKGFNYDKEITDSKLYEKMRAFAPLLNKKRYKVTYVGLENIPAEGGFILASNHMNALDPAIIGSGILNRQLYFMGKKELFENKLVGYLFSKMNGFPVARGSGDILCQKGSHFSLLGCLLVTQLFWQLSLLRPSWEQPLSWPWERLLSLSPSWP